MRAPEALPMTRHRSGRRCAHRHHLQVSNSAHMTLCSLLVYAKSRAGLPHDGPCRLPVKLAPLRRTSQSNVAWPKVGQAGGYHPSLRRHFVRRVARGLCSDVTGRRFDSKQDGSNCATPPALCRRHTCLCPHVCSKAVCRCVRPEVAKEHTGFYFHQHLARKHISGSGSHRCTCV